MQSPHIGGRFISLWLEDTDPMEDPIMNLLTLPTDRADENRMEPSTTISQVFTNSNSDSKNKIYLKRSTASSTYKASGQKLTAIWYESAITESGTAAPLGLLQRLYRNRNPGIQDQQPKESAPKENEYGQPPRTPSGYVT